MKGKEMKKAFLSMVAAAGLAVPAMADVDGDLTGSTLISLALGGMTTEVYNSNVVLTDGGSGAADILLLTDTTGSMGSFISSVRSGFGDIVSGVEAENPAADFRWGVADYKDDEDGEPYFTDFLNVGAQFGTASDAQTAIDNYLANGGDDWPEANLAALKAAADGWEDPTVLGGRSDAARVIIWAGDAHGWENGAKGYPYPTLQETINALVAADAVVIGLSDTLGSLEDLDDPGPDNLSGLGGDPDGRPQASTITDATGGIFFDDIDFSDTSGIEDIINENITAILEEVDNITLSVDGDLGGWTLEVLNSPVTGPFASGDSPVLSDFDLKATAPSEVDSRTVNLVLRGDGVILDTLEVNLEAVPEPASAALLLGGLALLGRRRR